MDCREYQNKCLRTSGSLECEDLLINGALGLAGESGEVIDYIKKHIYQDHPFNPSKIKEEMGDVLWYVCSILSGSGIWLDDVMEYNIKKLESRYPEGFDADRSINREV